MNQCSLLLSLFPLPALQISTLLLQSKTNPHLQSASSGSSAWQEQGEWQAAARKKQQQVARLYLTQDVVLFHVKVLHRVCKGFRKEIVV